MTEDDLAPLRAEIDAIDDRIVDLLAERMAIAHKVAAIKAETGVPVVLPERIASVRKRAAARGAGKGLDPAYVDRLYAAIIEETCRVETALLKCGDPPDGV